jgi:hypothetical protein
MLEYFIPANIVRQLIGADTIFVICMIFEITSPPPCVYHVKTLKKLYKIEHFYKKYVFIAKIFKIISVSMYSEFYEIHSLAVRHFDIQIT